MRNAKTDLKSERFMCVPIHDCRIPNLTMNIQLNRLLRFRGIYTFIWPREYRSSFTNNFRTIYSSKKKNPEKCLELRLLSSIGQIVFVWEITLFHHTLCPCHSCFVRSNSLSCLTAHGVRCGKSGIVPLSDNLKCVHNCVPWLNTQLPSIVHNSNATT